MNSLTFEICREMGGANPSGSGAVFSPWANTTGSGSGLIRTDLDYASGR